MNEKFKYSFDESTEILFKYYYGDITLNDISSSWDFAIEKGLIPANTKGFIIDYRKAKFKMDLNETNGIADYYHHHLEIFGDKKIAIITISPDQVIIPSLVELKDDGYSSRPFYTLKAALSWVLS